MLKSPTSSKGGIGLLTTTPFLTNPDNNWYISQILQEDALLAKGFEAFGFSVSRRAWDLEQPWGELSALLFRTPWDYSKRPDAFFPWFRDTSSLVTYINPREIIEWNADKHYLNELSARGISISPTVFAEQGERIGLAELFSNTGWPEAILKPAISGGGRNTYRIAKNQAREFEGVFQQLLEKESLLFQFFERDILTEGEVSYIFFNLKYSHAVVKRARPGEFRVQDDHGGKVWPWDPPKAEIAFAEGCLGALPFKPVYARVDVLRKLSGEQVLMELELFEPELFLRFSEGSGHRYAGAVIEFLSEQGIV